MVSRLMIVVLCTKEIIIEIKIGFLLFIVVVGNQY